MYKNKTDYFESNSIFWCHSQLSGLADRDLLSRSCLSDDLLDLRLSWDLLLDLDLDL